MAKGVPYKKNQVHIAEVKDLTSKGEGVVKLDNYPFFVEGVIPGEVIEFKITKVGKSFGFAIVKQFIKESNHRVPVRDIRGTQSGTFVLQHMDYPSQLSYKENLVRQAFERLGKFKDLTIRPIMGMDNPWAYRNKAQVPVREVEGKLHTGFFRKNSHELIPMENFYIQDSVIDTTIVTVRDILREYGIPAYHEVMHEGIVRHVVVKRGHYSGQIMIILVTTQREVQHLHVVVEAIQERVKDVVSIVQNIQPLASNTILGKENHVLWGQGYIEDKMLDMTFKISANSFYQVNTPQAERLYQTAIEAADLTGSQTVLDAYCGIGTLSLALAKHAKQVYAMEIVPEAITMAKLNQEANQLANVNFEVGAAGQWLPLWNADGVNFDVIVVDPPRKGLEREFIEALLEQQAQRVVYVSCNPATLARDARIIVDGGYQLEWVQPVDLFGQTPHVEAVALMTRIEA